MAIYDINDNRSEKQVSRINRIHGLLREVDYAENR